MNREDWPVQNYSIRPAGSPDHCFYCNQPRGALHRADCVIRHRTVVVKFEIELVIDEPVSFTPEQIEFRYNEGSWCGNNFIQMLEDYKTRSGGCLCDILSAEFVREATEEDEVAGKLAVADLPS